MSFAVIMFSNDNRSYEQSLTNTITLIELNKDDSWKPTGYQEQYDLSYSSTAAWLIKPVSTCR